MLSLLGIEIYNSQNMQMEDILSFLTVDLGSQATLAHDFFMRNQMIDPILRRATEDTEKSKCQTELPSRTHIRSHWELQGFMLFGREGGYGILIHSEKRHISVEHYG